MTKFSPDIAGTDIESELTSIHQPIANPSGVTAGASGASKDKTEREMLTVIMLKDVLDGIEYYYGKEGLEQVAHFATMQNRSRESNRIMDSLELLYGPFPTPQESASE